MQYLKENKGLVLLTVLMLVSFLYLDRPVASWVRETHGGSSGVYSILALAGSGIRLAADGATLITGSFLLYVFGRYWNRKFFKAGKGLFIGLIASGASAQALKRLAGRARPGITDLTEFIGPNIQKGYESFPSGHTTLAFAFASISSYYFPRYRALFYAFAVLVGIERVGEHAHFPSDVLAGIIAGTIVAKITVSKIRDTA